LPRIEKIIACTPEQCVCGNCGKENSVIGYEKSEQLDVKPAEYFVVVTKREKRACKACEEQGVECAAAPVRIIEKGLASDRSSSIRSSANMPTTVRHEQRTKRCASSVAQLHNR
jgi:transposase